ncbi:hypothetical protein BDK51DRAFT_29951 [Blyttiomyces helicus]|uniref:DH domain-containing protein n=1 Tax=Blyttiomyces helicus TaxID=388810 RepID=A0A4P9WC52_9FUNG|nr:hypothetical protein BDK51DRAFT_29951 [Blyttiomyces helicus]|eukprot:RKO88768.1 hypothetical protein BDK51DRAFT_29951 [Blyttiomyces helicus]
MPTAPHNPPHPSELDLTFAPTLVEKGRLAAAASFEEIATLARPAGNASRNTRPSPPFLATSTAAAVLPPARTREVAAALIWRARSDVMDLAASPDDAPNEAMEEDECERGENGETGGDNDGRESEDTGTIHSNCTGASDAGFSFIASPPNENPISNSGDESPDGLFFAAPTRSPVRAPIEDPRNSSRHTEQRPISRFGLILPTELSEPASVTSSPQSSRSNPPSSPKTLGRSPRLRRPKSVATFASRSSQSPTSPTTNQHRLSYNGYQNDHLAALATTLTRADLSPLAEALRASPPSPPSLPQAPVSDYALPPSPGIVSSNTIDATDIPPMVVPTEPPSLVPTSTESLSLEDLYLYERPPDQKMVRRGMIMTELLETERMYVQDLRTLIENCFDRLNAASWLPLEKKYSLMRNANELYKFQQEFLTVVEAAMASFDPSQPENPVPIALAFLSMQERFSVYSHYCTQHEGAVRILGEYENRPEMITFLKDFKGRAKTKLDIKAFLIKPVQRICRYPLLLSEIIKCTPADADDFDDLLRAHSVMQSVAADVDSAKLVMENLHRSDRFFERLENTLQIDLPKRIDCGELILGGALYVVNNEYVVSKMKYRGVFIFPGFLFMIKPKRHNSYNLKCCLPLAAYELQLGGGKEGSAPHSWILRHIEHGTYYVFSAQSDRERATWIDVLSRLTTEPSTFAALGNYSANGAPQSPTAATPSAEIRPVSSALNMRTLRNSFSRSSLDVSVIRGDADLANAYGTGTVSHRAFSIRGFEGRRRHFWRQSSAADLLMESIGQEAAVAAAAAAGASSTAAVECREEESEFDVEERA